MSSPSGATRCALYLRVSTQDQSCDLQRRELEEYVQARGWTLVHTYEETASGTTAKRPQLQTMLKDARARRFDVIAVWKLDRAARSLSQLVMMLQELNDLGVTFFSLRDQLDLGTATGRLTLHLLGAMAEFEADLIRERTRAGLAHARSRGVQIGRPRHGREEEVRALRRQGLSQPEIKRRTGLSKGAIWRALKSS